MIDKIGLKNGAINPNNYYIFRTFNNERKSDGDTTDYPSL